MTLPKEAELLATSSGEIEVRGSGADVIVTLTADAKRKIAFEVANTAHRRFSLGLENIRGSFDAAVLNIFISGPTNRTSSDQRNVLAGSVALYGLRRASMPEPTALGLTFILDITRVITEPFVLELVHANEMRVSIAPDRQLPASTHIIVSRVIIFSTLFD